MWETLRRPFAGGGVFHISIGTAQAFCTRGRCGLQQINVGTVPHEGPIHGWSADFNWPDLRIYSLCDCRLTSFYQINRYGLLLSSEICQNLCTKSFIYIL